MENGARPGRSAAWPALGVSLVGMLLAGQVAIGGPVLFALFVVAALGVFVAGVVVAASATRPGRVSTDPARLEELEPLPPSSEERPPSAAEGRS